MLVSMVEFAIEYQRRYAERYGGKTVRVAINDLSLPLGGLYDIFADWDCPISGTGWELRRT